jgi:hypothetical protein
MQETQLVCLAVSFDAQNLTLFLEVLQQGDVLKVDFGVHVNGRIVDSAFTLNFDPTYDKLVEAAKAATDTGVRVRTLILARLLLMVVIYRKLELM